MKKATVIISFIFSICITTAFVQQLNNEEKPYYIPASTQQTGDIANGYVYLTTGDFLKSGVPYNNFIFLNGKDKNNYLNRTGKNANVEQGFNVITNKDGIDIVIPTCLQCHSQVFDDSLYVGMGNSFIDFSNIGKQNNIVSDIAIKAMQTFNPKGYAAAKPLITSFKAVLPNMETEVRGVNAADRLAILLVAHRDPITLAWSKEPILNYPDETIPTDVPAWWMLKKKNAMFYNGFGRGDFGRFLMLSNLLTVKDTAEAREVYNHFGDVLAYIKSIEPPKYPKPINEELATTGETIFINNCSKCHGTYGANETYPNLLIPSNIIQTDSLLFKANYQNPQFIDWFNKSWFAQEPFAAKLVPANGYVAPPLDGVWSTAPYFHNGSIPNLEAVINSKIRPTFWSRNFNKPKYNFEQLGWEFEVHETANKKKYYNTTLKGYGNYGHYFGDKLTDTERKALLEYLKTL
ncbi:MAG: hypothetical protein V9E96_09870 [Chitinophagaceae bacterium]